MTCHSLMLHSSRLFSRLAFSRSMKKQRPALVRSPNQHLPGAGRDALRKPLSAKAPYTSICSSKPFLLMRRLLPNESGLPSTESSTYSLSLMKSLTESPLLYTSTSSCRERSSSSVKSNMRACYQKRKRGRRSFISARRVPLMDIDATKPSAKVVSTSDFTKLTDNQIKAEFDRYLPVKCIARWRADLDIRLTHKERERFSWASIRHT